MSGTKTLTEGDIEVTLNKLRAADTDKKVDIVQFFGLQLEDVDELPETTIDPILLLLPPLLRTPHTLLLTSTLTSLLPFFIPLIPTTANQSQGHLKLAVLQLLPALIERLNDPKDRIHSASANSIYLLGNKVHFAESSSSTSGLASSGSTSAPTSSTNSTLGQSVSVKGKEKIQETLVQNYERQLRDTLSSKGKGTRTKVEVLKILIRLRAELGNKMGLKSWLAPLVELLEDGDGGVRDQAKETVVALLSPTSTPPAARSELKKLLVARSVRKTIADNIIARVFAPPGVATAAASGRTSEASTPTGNGERILSSSRTSMNAGTQTRSGANTPVPVLVPTTGTGTTTADDVEIVYVASPKDLENEFTSMLPHFQGKETEQNWLPREKSVIRIRGMIRGRAADQYQEAFVNGLKGGIVEGVSKTIVSLRTTVAQQSCFLMKELVEALGSSFDPFVENLLPILGKMAGFTKKIIAERSQACVTSIIVHTTIPSRIFIGHIAAGVSEKNIQTRHFCTGHLKTFLDIHGTKSKGNIDSTPGLIEQLEGAVKKALADVNPAVRELARAAFWSFHSVWQVRATTIMNGLDGQARKQLDKANPHDNDGSNLIAPSTSTAGTGTGTTKPAPAKRTTSAMAALLAEKRRAKAAELAVGRMESPRIVSNPVPGSPSIQQGQGLTRSISNHSISSRSTRQTQGHLSRADTATSQDDEQVEEVNENDIEIGQSLASPTAAARTRATTNTTPRTTPKAVPNSPRDLLNQSSRSRSSSLGRNGNSSPQPPSRGSPTNRDSPLRQSSTFPQHPGSPLRSPVSSNTSASAGIHLKTPTLNRKPLPSFAAAGAGAGAGVGLGLRAQEEWTETPSRPAGTLHAQGGVMVDDAIKAQAEQAESAARQLMEYEEENHVHGHDQPVTPLRNGSTTYGTNGTNGDSQDYEQVNLFQTPQSRNSKKAWEDSPRPETVTPLMVEKLKQRKHERSWWVKRQELMDKASPLRPSNSVSIQQDLEALEKGKATLVLRNLQKLALFSSEHPIDTQQEPINDTEEDDGKAIWVEDRIFERILGGLLEFLSSTNEVEKKDDNDNEDNEEMLEQALVVLWEIVQHQWLLFDGHEQDLCDALFALRGRRSITILESTNALLSLLTQVSNPIYLLSIIRSSLQTFLSAHPASISTDDTTASAQMDKLSLSSPSSSESEVRNSGYLYGLTGMGMCVLGLPKAVIEAEGQKLGVVIMDAMKESLIVRQAAQSLLLAIQCILRDSSKTLKLVDGLNKGQKDLAVYYMAQNGILDDLPERIEGEAEGEAEGGDQEGEGEREKESGEVKVMNEMIGLMARNIR